MELATNRKGMGQIVIGYQPIKPTTNLRSSSLKDKLRQPKSSRLHVENVTSFRVN
jgi:hypothetical protein